MFCRKCGQKIEEGQKFCKACGTKVEVVTMPQEQSVAQEQPVAQDEYQFQGQAKQPAKTKKKIHPAAVIGIVIAALLVIGIAGLAVKIYVLDKSNIEEFISETFGWGVSDLEDEELDEDEEENTSDEEKDAPEIEEEKDKEELEDEEETENEEEYVSSDYSNEGKVLNIYTWNTEFINRIQDYYPGYEIVEKDISGKIGDVDVKFTTVVSDDNRYQDNLDLALSAQAYVADDDKVDLFLVESDYALKYTDSDLTMSMAALGLDDSVFADQYQYTKDVVTVNGWLKGSSWQGCPGALIYRADIAQKVLGTSEPHEVQRAVNNWDSFMSTAKKMKKAGYRMTASIEDTYRVFANNVTSKWVDDFGMLNIDANIMSWIDYSKKMVDAGYTGTSDMWGDDWADGFNSDSNVFCYFGPAWFIDFCMRSDMPGSVGEQGLWRVTPGPQGFFWGGTWICVATGTDNKTLVADIIKTMTTDATVLENILFGAHDFVNNQSVIAAYVDDYSFEDDYLGGQNPLGVFNENAQKIDSSNMTSYDVNINEKITNSMRDYFTGHNTKKEAFQDFYGEIESLYPGRFQYPEIVDDSSDDTDYSDDFIFPDSDSRFLTDADIKPIKKNYEKVRRAINEIYARRGLIFEKPENINLFGSMSWYKPKTKDMNKVEEKMNKFERANIELLAKYKEKLEK